MHMVETSPLSFEGRQDASCSEHQALLKAARAITLALLAKCFGEFDNRLYSTVARKQMEAQAALQNSQRRFAAMWRTCWMAG